VHVGVHIAQLGQLAEAKAVRRSVHAAEQIGYQSVWVLDRLLSPEHPRTGYGGLEGVPLPEEQKRVLDPIGVLTYAAGITQQVGLGVSVLVAPWYPPVLLARALTTLDVLSEGRLTVALGLGWSPEEYDAVGVPMSGLGARLEETLDVFDAVWGDDPVSHKGAASHIVASSVQPKPVQRPGSGTLLAAYTPAGLDRVARRADGWNPAGVDVTQLAPMWQVVCERAVDYGRDPAALSLVVRANIVLHPEPLGDGRPSYWGSLEQIADDLGATESAGAHEVILGVYGDPTLDQALDLYAQLAELLAERRARPG